MREDRHISAIDGTPDLRAEKPVVDVGDLAAVKAAQQEVKTAAQIEAETVRALMGNTRGRKYFFDLLAKCRILRNPFSPDALSMAFACGEMNVGQQIFLNLQSACPDLYLQMMEENNG